MLLRYKIKKYISLLLVLFLLCMIMPDASINEECLDDSAQGAPFIFHVSYVHTDIAFLAANYRKATSYTVSAEIYNCLIDHICLEGVLENKSIYYELPTDYRKELMKTILHYIHGSKYKDRDFLSRQWT